jgi:hydrogenase expression/formation protein HypE
MAAIETDKKKENLILLAHGDGGLLTNQLFKKYFLPFFDNKILNKLTDAALFSVSTGKLAMTTDSFVVDPIFFSGGDIGKLAICGTVNDLAVSGAKPLYITASFIIEEGFPISDLERIIASMSETCKKAGVSIIGGDTKVVGHGQADKIFITTTGLGSILPEADLGYQRIKPDDVVIVNGPLGNHGVSILIERESFSFETKVLSDCAPLNLITEKLFTKFKGIKFMRDLTRGGLATNAKEIAQAADIDIIFREEDIPIDDDVKSITETLGLDPLYLANEGKFLIIASKDEAKKMLKFLREKLSEKNANIIGTVQAGKGDVYLQTALGGRRRLNMLAGAPLPRIC